MGRDPDANIPLTDTLVSRRHASITVGDAAEIADLNSANGVEIDGRAVVRAAVTPSSRIRIGEDELRWIPAVDENRSPHRPQPTSAATDFSFIRSPRVEPVYRGSAVDLPQPPGTVDKTRFPMLAMVAPLGMGVALFAV
ncbi:FHA domain-containing protein, partial [Paenibacillus sp. TAF58]